MAKRITNYEKNREIIDLYAVAQVQWGIDAMSGEITPCCKIPACNSLCEFKGGENCEIKRMEWNLNGAKMIKIDGKKYKENTWYTMQDGKVIEWKED